jgi:predicted CoA-binding protein
MDHDGLTDDDIRSLLSGRPRIAMVGASNRPDRPSNGVLRFLLARGFTVVPVNPGLAGQLIHGQVVMPGLEEAAPLDLVDIFRAPESVGPVVAEAVRLGARTIWMQLGVVNHDAAAIARQASLTVVMNRCPVIEFARLGLV